MNHLALFPMWFLPFLFALCFHEFAHGWVASRMGDNTARIMGRLTMNPLVHMDLIGTLLMPLLAYTTGMSIFFGWAKPVPVNARNLKTPRTDMFWIALAGPLSNIFLAAVGSLIMFISFQTIFREAYFGDVIRFFDRFVLINLFLAIFNLIPIHPLDGGKVLDRFLPPKVSYWMDQNQQVLSIGLMLLIFTGNTQFLVPPVQWMHHLLTFWARGL